MPAISCTGDHRTSRLRSRANKSAIFFCNSKDKPYKKPATLHTTEIMTVITRFAPSPTGFLHIGGARTALFNWLYAKHTGGTLVLRVEDTDRARNTEEAARAIYDGLRWLGLDWDEGPQAGGNFGPYFQIEREAVYQSYLDKLRAADRVYEDAGSVRFLFAREKIVVDDII